MRDIFIFFLLKGNKSFIVNKKIKGFENSWCLSYMQACMKSAVNFWLTPVPTSLALNLLQFQYTYFDNQYQQEKIRSWTFFFRQEKLVKLFSRQLVAKQKCNEDWNHNEKLRYYPKLEQWLQVVGINEEAIKVHVYYFMCALLFHFNERNALNLFP